MAGVDFEMSHADRTRADSLVDRLADSAGRMEARDELERLGDAALPALRAGLRHGDWRVRMWCAVELDHRSDPNGRAVPIFESLLRSETDAKLLLHARRGLALCRDARLSAP